jgi:predicted PurR-regulated permease PerM
VLAAAFVQQDSFRDASEPIVTGASIKMSAFAVVSAVFFWSFKWGVAGAFIGVPILIVFIVYCAQFPQSRWIATVLSGSAADAPARKPE